MIGGRRKPALIIMMCLNPMVLHRKGYDDIKVPCGRCRWCRQIRSNHWAMRMMHESEYWKEKVFITLTYNNINLPIDGQLRPEHLRDFIKRIRKMLGCRKIKYFACGEYGKKYGRPHYHLVVFGLGLEKVLIEKEWSMGFVKVGLVNYKTCRYVSKYITKTALGKSRKEDIKNGKVPEFQRCSHGIGLSWVMERNERIARKGISYKGKQVSLPRYYVHKLREKGIVPVSIIDDVSADEMQRISERFRQNDLIGNTRETDNTRYLELLNQRIEESKSEIALYGALDKDNQ